LSRCWPFSSSQRLFALAAFGLVLATVIHLSGQASSLTLLSRDGRRAIPITVANNLDFVALEDLAAAFQLTVREEAGAVTVTYQSRTIILTPDQTLASVSGRLISLAAAPRRAGPRLLVPLDFVNRALALVYDLPLDLRRQSRLLVVGTLRVPRVAVRHDPLGNSARVTIEATPAASIAVSQGDGQLFFRFDADGIDASIPGIQPQGFVQALRAIDAVTLAADLGPRFGSYRATTQNVGDTTRVVVDVLGPPAEAGATPGPASPAAPAAPAGELPVFGPPVATIRTLVIDPGHGGDDRGASGDGSLLEKDLTLAVARRLEAMLATRLGIRVLLTREDDRDVSLERRTALANNNKADVFISLHANASPRPSAGGAAIYIAAFDDEARARAARPPARLSVFGGGQRDIELVPWDLAQIRHVERSGQLAAILEQELGARVPLDERAVARAPFRVLESANMPAVLIEMGYLTNPDQAALLTGGAFQNTFAQAVFDAVVAFRDVIAGADRRE
jgi:N-acetylmuramoyl-L-alanine amidase